MGRDVDLVFNPMELTVQRERPTWQELGISVARHEGGERESALGWGGSVVREVL